MTDEATPPIEETADGAAEGAPDAAALLAEIAALKDQLLRTAADAENTRRRAEREANDARAYAIQKFAQSLLGVADNLSRALLASPCEAADPAVKNFILGIEMTEKELQSAFERNGLKKIDPPPGARFDPHLHQAMMEQESAEVEPGSIVQVMQAGYELYGRVVRPAMVAVSPKAARPAAPAGPGYAGDPPPAGGSVDQTA